MGVLAPWGVPLHGLNRRHTRREGALARTSVCVRQTSVFTPHLCPCAADICLHRCEVASNPDVLLEEDRGVGALGSPAARILFQRAGVAASGLRGPRHGVTAASVGSVKGGVATMPVVVHSGWIVQKFQHFGLCLRYWQVIP